MGFRVRVKGIRAYPLPTHDDDTAGLQYLVSLFFLLVLKRF